MNMDIKEVPLFKTEPHNVRKSVRCENLEQHRFPYDVAEITHR